MNCNEQLQHETISLEIPKDNFELSDHEPPDHKRSFYVIPSQTFGKVLIATLKPSAGGLENPVKAAARKLRVDKAKTESTAVASWLDRQTRVWSSCSHDNILKFIGYYVDEDFSTIYLFSPYMNNGNAEKYLKEKKPSIGERLLLLKDTVMGLDYLHNLSPPVIHGNLRAANVLITENGRAVLGDVGLYTLENRVELIKGSQYSLLLPWFSPELLSTSERTTRSDIWAWGCLALELIRGTRPYSRFHPIFIDGEMLEGGLPEDLGELQNWPDGLLELVRKCWSFGPEDRPNVRTCVESINTTLGLIESSRTEVMDCLGSSFIEEERIQGQANETSLRSGSINCTTRIAGLSPLGALVVVKEIDIREIGSALSRVDFIKILTAIGNKGIAGQTAHLSSIKHENILELIGYSATYSLDTVWLVAPYLVNGNLLDYMHKQNQLDVNGKLELARHVLDGLQFLHSREPPVAHGNITPSNVLINEAGKAILSDVGLTTMDWHPIVTGFNASVRWSSPEINLGGLAVIQSDIWSWACVVLQLVTGRSPYLSIKNEDDVKVVMSFGKPALLTPEAFHELDETPAVLLSLLRRCWEFDVSQRPSARECTDLLKLMLGADLEACSGNGDQQSFDDITPQKQLEIPDRGNEEQVIRELEREADTWRCDPYYPHILKFVGKDKPANILFINPLVQNGNLFESINGRQVANRITLLCEISDAKLKPTLHKPGIRVTIGAKILPLSALVVLKETKVSGTASTSRKINFFKRFRQHMAALWSIRHESIVEFVGYSIATTFFNVLLITHHMANGNLMQYVQNREVAPNRKLELALDIANGLQYLHNREPPIVHGHLTPSNVLINEAGKAMLDDWDLGAFHRYHPSAESPKASVRWSSPEVNRGDSAVVQSDVWSWACVIAQLVTSNPPYSSIENENDIRLTMSMGKWAFRTPEVCLEPDDIPDFVMRLLRRCWEFDSFKRPEARECIDALDTILHADLGARPTHSPGDDISRFITSVSPQAICINGRFGDVFKGTHKTMGDVALKRLRIGGAALDEQVIRRFKREADTWRRLNHPHVLKFLGTYKPEAHLYLVSPFAANGTFLEYISERPAVNRIRLLCETSDAVGYLHREDIIHGDIKASNLLISEGGQVLLCDFGLAKTTYAQTSTALKGAGTFRWQSPELWDDEPRSFASDVYAFSMTIVEVLTGLPPFSHLDKEVAVCKAVYLMDARPTKSPMGSNGVSYENVWEVAEACWPKYRKTGYRCQRHSDF